VLRLMTHPGVGPPTALAFVIIIITPDRFPCGKQIGSYVGLIPCEDSSALRSGLASSVPTPGDAARTPNRQGGDGGQTSGSVALDVAHSLEREFEEVIMVEVVIGEMFGSD
jgi:hypothetical protein